jgi:hypothetical protein
VRVYKNNYLLGGNKEIFYNSRVVQFEEEMEALGYRALFFQIVYLFNPVQRNDGKEEVTRLVKLLPTRFIPVKQTRLKK